jgi:cysteinyl-tRNA synthetase
MPALQLYNTLTRRKEEFKPLKPGYAGVYTCGPTPYWFQHAGNLRAAYFWDILVKTLRRFGYEVKHVMNVTDVGHLKSDADEGEDKMIIAMKREGKSPWDIARFYEKAYMDDRAELNIPRPDVVCRATEHIADIIKMVQCLEKNGYTYVVDGNVYYDTAKYPRYGQLWGGKRTSSEEFSRVEGDKRKRSPADFVLWFSQSKFPDQVMKWDSPWGVGFPGWHIECSAMSAKYLGEQFDIHCGGQEHIAIHHTNELAQSEGCFCQHLKEGTHWVNYWLHNAWLMNSQGEKMAKSKGEIATLAEIKEKGLDALSLRLFFLGTSYNKPQNFSWEALGAAQSAYNSLKEKLQEWSSVSAATQTDEKTQPFIEKFDAALADDLNTPQALAIMWEVVKDQALSPAQKRYLLANFDSVLSLGLSSVQKGTLSAEEQTLLDARASARKAKDFKISDELRDALAAKGVVVKDTAQGQTWTRS